MKPRTTLMLLLMTMTMVAPILSQTGKEQRVKRHILGEQLDYGRQAAAFGLWNEAIFHWEKVVVADPQNFSATNNLAVAYESVGNYEKAEQMYRSALDMDEDNREIRKNMKRFRSFYRKHKRQLAREIKSKRDRQNQSKETPITEEKESKKEIIL